MIPSKSQYLKFSFVHRWDEVQDDNPPILCNHYFNYNIDLISLRFQLAIVRNPFFDREFLNAILHYKRARAFPESFPTKIKMANISLRLCNLNERA